MYEGVTEVNLPKEFIGEEDYIEETTKKNIPKDKLKEEKDASIEETERTDSEDIFIEDLQKIENKDETDKVRYLYYHCHRILVPSSP